MRFAARGLIREARPLAILVALWAVLFRRILWNGELLFGGEVHEILYPYHRFLWDELRSGRGFPLWNPYPFFGYPLAAAVQAGLFYPANWLLGLSGQIEKTLSASIALHILLAGLLMYAYVRAGLGFGRAPALGAAAVYAFSGHMLGDVEQLHDHATLAWVPLVLLSIEKALAPALPGPPDAASRRRVGWLCVGGLATGLSLLGGMVQQSYYMCTLIFFYIVARSFPEWRGKGPLSVAASLFVRAGIVLGAGIGLFAVQLLPCAELVHESARRSMEYSDAISQAGGSLSPTDLLGLIVLNIKGWGPLSARNTIHVGLVPAGLALWMAVRSLRRGPVGVDRFFAVAAVAAQAMAVDSPLYRGLYRLAIPGFGLFHDQVRVMTVFLLGVSVLWAHCLEEIRSGNDPAQPGSRASRIFDGTQSGPLALLIVMTWIVCIVYAFSLTGLREGPDAWQVELDLPSRSSSLLMAIGSGAAAICAMGLLVAGRITRRSAAWALSLIALVPLGFFGCPLIRTFPAAQVRGWIQGPPHLARILSEGSGATLFRTANLDDDGVATGPFENEFRVPMPTGFGSLIPYRVLSFTAASAASVGPDRLTAYLDFLKYPAMRNVSACRFLVARSAARASGLPSNAENIGSWEGYVLYRNRSALPRAFLVGSDRKVGGPSEALAVLRDMDFDPRKAVLLESGKRENPAAGSGRATPGPALSVQRAPRWLPGAEIVEDRPERVVVEVAPEPEKDERQWLVLADTFYPGWAAEVDGRPTPIFRADYLFRCVRLPKGAREVVFTYEPSSFHSGLILTVTTGLLLGALFVALGVAARRSPGRGGSSRAGRG